MDPGASTVPKTNILSPSPCQVLSQPARASVCSWSRRPDPQRAFPQRTSLLTATGAPNPALVLCAKPSWRVRLRASLLHSPSFGSRVKVQKSQSCSDSSSLQRSGNSGDSLRETVKHPAGKRTVHMEMAAVSAHFCATAAVGDTHLTSLCVYECVCA